MPIPDKDPDDQQEDGGKDEESPLPAQYQQSQRYTGSDDQLVIERGGFKDFIDQVYGECDEEDYVRFAAHLRKGFVINGEKCQHRKG